MTWKVVLGNAGAQQPKAGVGPQAKEQVAQMTHGTAVRVLVVDDEPSICKALTMALSRAGYEAIAAQSGESALAIIRNEHVDVMLIDLRIPDMRGDVIFEVAAGHQRHDCEPNGFGLSLDDRLDSALQSFDLIDCAGAGYLSALDAFEVTHESPAFYTL